MKNALKIITLSAAVLGLSACATTENSAFKGYETATVENYVCGADKVTATFMNNDQNSIALVSVNGEAPVLLANVISASGAKYAGGIYELWTKGKTATFTNFMGQSKNGVACKSAS